MKIENIKFKAKQLNSGKWFEGDLVHLGNRVCIGGDHIKDGITDVDPSTVCQFTGEKDMNGTEIYIGDFISNLETGSVIEVVWNDRLKRLDCKFLYAEKGIEIPFGIFITRYAKSVVLKSKFDKEK